MTLFRRRMSFRACPLFHRFPVASIVLAVVTATAAAAAQTCTPPDDIKAKLHDKPGAAVLNDLGLWFAQHQQYACAANAFGSSLQTDAQQPDLPHIVFEFGVSLYLSGDSKEAVPSLKEAERLGYRDSKLHVILATALDSARDFATAEPEWRKALAFDPDETTALDALSSDLLSDGDFKAVVELLDTPRLKAWRTAQQAMSLGTAYSKLGKPDEALRVLEDGLNTNPDSYDLAEQLAGVLTQQGRNDEGAVVFKLANERRRQNASQAGK
jgi:Flp pilus assembly protein TadD